MEGGTSVPAADDGGVTAGSAAPPSSSSSSVEALLSVPLDLILRELPTPPASASTTATGAPKRKTRRRTLLSRSEATTLLRVTQLSIEQDVLVGLAADVLANAHMCSTLRRRIEDSCRVLYGGTSHGGDNNNGSASSSSGETVPPVRYPRHLLALLPILSVHADSIPDRTVRHVQAESQRILTELAQCATTLRQCAEHNWTVSEHLLVDVGGAVGDGAGGTTTGSNVGRDKESLAEIEEAVCDRIEGLVGMAMDMGSTSTRGDTDDDTNIKSPASSRKRKRGAEDASGAVAQDVFDVSVDCKTGEFVSMAELCCRLFPDLSNEIFLEAKAKASSGNSENTATSTAGDGETAKKQTGESPSGVEPMDVDKPPLADAGTTRSVANEPGTNGDVDNQASASSAANNIDRGKKESSGAKSHQSSDDEDNDSDGKGSETKKNALSNANNDGYEDLPRDASSSSSPSQSQVNAAAALAVLAST